jgi:SAM-dependent methyltransferase
MKYPDHETYEKLYAAYFRRSAKDLTDLAPKLKNGSVAIDICCGGCRLTDELLARKVNVVCVDNEERMIPEHIWEHARKLKKPIVQIYLQPAEEFVQGGFDDRRQVDAIFCQNAVTYWLRDTDPKMLGRLLKSGGVFIANTFRHMPMERPSVRSYAIKGKNYIEVSYTVNGKVHHVQCAEGMEPHITSFDYIPEDELKAYCEAAGCDVELKTTDSTVVVVAIKRKA